MRASWRSVLEPHALEAELQGDEEAWGYVLPELYQELGLVFTGASVGLR